MCIRDRGSLVTAAAFESPDPPPVERLLCGTTGLDYVGLPASTGMILSFRAGRAAYAPPNADAAPDARNTLAADPAPPALTTLGTTAWSWISGDGSLGYYAQPEDAPFYTGGKAGFLDYLEISAATLTTCLLYTSARVFPRQRFQRTRRDARPGNGKDSQRFDTCREDRFDRRIVAEIIALCGRPADSRDRSAVTVGAAI